MNGIAKGIGGLASGVGTYVNATYQGWKETTGRNNIVDKNHSHSEGGMAYKSPTE